MVRRLSPIVPGSTERTGVEARERLFAAKYIELKFNGAAAAAAAGFSPKSAVVQASQLLSRKNVQHYIEEALDKVLTKSTRNTDAIIAELEKIGFSSMGDYLHITSDGDPYIDLSKATPEQLDALGEVTVDDYVEGRGEDARDVKRVKIKLLDKKGSLVDLLKYHTNGGKMPGDDNRTININNNTQINITLDQASDEYMRLIDGK